MRSSLLLIAGLMVGLMVGPAMGARPSEGDRVAALALIPMPREVTLGGNKPVKLTAKWRLDTAGDELSAGLLQEEIERALGFRLEVNDRPGVHAIRLVEGKPTGERLFDEQGYTLEVKADGITIAAPSETGRFYGVQTLRQLIRSAGKDGIPAVSIRDWPALEWRGLSDDISRGQVSTIDDFKRIIADLAFYKFNMYQPYIEDMFRFDASPNVGKDRGALTKEEMQILVREAARNHMNLTPVFETLGHQDRLLGLPENRQYAEIQDPAREPWSFAPANPAALEFVKKLVDEMAVATESPFFHIGGDETADVGTGVSKQLVEERGVGRVHAEWYGALASHLKEKHNRRTMVYDDMILHHPDSRQFLPKDIILIDWKYLPKQDFSAVAKLKSEGFDSIMTSPGVWGWAEFYPNHAWALKNIANATDTARTEQIMGSIVSSWGDEGAENMRSANFFGYAFHAASSWEAATPDPAVYARRFVIQHHGLDSAALAEAHFTLGRVPDDLGIHHPGNYFHRIPAPKPLEADRLAVWRDLRTRMEGVREVIARDWKGVRLHHQAIESMDQAARRYIYLASREELMDNLARTMEGRKSSAELPREEQGRLLEDLTILRDQLVGIAADYPALWLETNKYPMLDYNMNRLNKQVAWLQGMITAMQTGELVVAPEPPAKP